jgi:hypothetical protein
MKQKIQLLMVLNILCGSTLWAQHAQFSNLPFNKITPEGWQRAHLEKQRAGLTGHLDEICEPFNEEVWTADMRDKKAPFYKRLQGKDEVLCWEPYEQCGYYIDGVVRCGLLLDNRFLLEKAREQIYGSIALEKNGDGIIRGEIPDRWGQVCFFRAFMAEYEATKNPLILEALKTHYDTDTYPMVSARNIFNIEQLVWLGQQTGERKYIDKAVQLYEGEIRRSDRMTNRLPDMASDMRQDCHNVTYFEALKNPIMLYMVTGNKKYLDAARNGFRKVDELHMLADGMPACEEGLSEVTSLSTHETCDVSVFTWACSYMLKATGEVEWADKIERAILNGGLGNVTMDFDAHQYLSAMNQISAGMGTIRNPISNGAWGGYMQRQMPWCCTGEVNRYFPNYVGFQWMKSKDGGLVKALYGPSECVFDVGGESIKLREDSFYPFSDEISIEVLAGEAAFPFSLRVPGWTESPSIFVNGKAQPDVIPGKFYVLDRTFKKGDVITLNFPKKIRFKQVEMNGMTVDYGPLLFTFPVAGTKEKILIDDYMWSGTPNDSEQLYGYNMFPTGTWRYVLIMNPDKDHFAKLVRNEKVDKQNPWNPGNPALQINVFGAEYPSWKTAYQTFKPHQGKEQFVEVTPNLPPRGTMTMVPVKCKKPERITLVPYGGTTLRMTVLPYWDARDIPAFEPNQINYSK